MGEKGVSKSTDLQRLGEEVWSKVDKINADLFSLTYGAFVCQMLKDLDSVSELNTQLEKMGYNIGIRLVDDFFASSSISRCPSLRDTAEIIAKVAFKSFLGVTAIVSSFDEKKSEFVLQYEENPLTNYVELPEEYKDNMWYANILCGVIRGALEMIQMVVECSFIKDTLRGDEVTEIQVKLIEIIKEDLPSDE
ncbi:trafficking protein particle complex subunit 3-like [Schistocerca gregaria]|uniref:trafficking protein particle complex subunit 3-like n=1 Tax=Schistocerca gregaria TaxID=7010 RepID=UPI00211EF76D|nr:trafficking protein particle complex subunit 3-like [Schistocerca gregaria]